MHTTHTHIYTCVCVCVCVCVYILLKFFSRIGYYKILSRGPYAIYLLRVCVCVLLTYFIYTNVYMLIPSSQFISPQLCYPLQ